MRSNGFDDEQQHFSFGFEILKYLGVLRAAELVSRPYEIALAGLLPRVRSSKWPKYAILCYHRIGTGGIPYYCNFPTRTFEAQIRYLVKHYRVISMDQLCEELDNPPRSESRLALAITFDDGYRGTYEEAFAVMRRYGVTATIYLAASAIDTGELLWYDRIFHALQVWPSGTFSFPFNSHGVHTYRVDSFQSRLVAAQNLVRWLRSLRNEERVAFCNQIAQNGPAPPPEASKSMMTWDQVREMHGAGFTFGAHTMTHPVVSRLAPEELAGELLASKELIESRIGTKVVHFAFPFGLDGEFSNASLRALDRCGYQSAATMVAGINVPGTDKLRLFRLGVGPWLPGILSYRLSRLFLTPARPLRPCRN